MKLVALVLALAACHEPVTLRRERTMIRDDAGARLAAATRTAPSGPSREEQFEEHYRAALAFYQQARYPEAIAEFEVAYGIDPQPLLIFNVGQAYRKAGRLAEARAKYQEYLDKDPAAERGRVDELIREVDRALKARR